jgi:hypothetical protein
MNSIPDAPHAPPEGNGVRCIDCIDCGPGVILEDEHAAECPGCDGVIIGLPYLTTLDDLFEHPLESIAWFEGAA